MISELVPIGSPLFSGTCLSQAPHGSRSKASVAARRSSARQRPDGGPTDNRCRVHTKNCCDVACRQQQFFRALRHDSGIFCLCQALDKSLNVGLSSSFSATWTSSRHLCTVSGSLSEVSAPDTNVGIGVPSKRGSHVLNAEVGSRLLKLARITTGHAETAIPLLWPGHGSSLPGRKRRDLKEEPLSGKV